MTVALKLYQEIQYKWSTALSNKLNHPMMSRQWLVGADYMTKLSANAIIRLMDLQKVQKQGGGGCAR